MNIEATAAVSKEERRKKKKTIQTKSIEVIDISDIGNMYSLTVGAFFHIIPFQFLPLFLILSLSFHFTFNTVRKSIEKINSSNASVHIATSIPNRNFKKKIFSTNSP